MFEPCRRGSTIKSHFKLGDAGLPNQSPEKTLLLRGLTGSSPNTASRHRCKTAHTWNLKLEHFKILYNNVPLNKWNKYQQAPHRVEGLVAFRSQTSWQNNKGPLFSHLAFIFCVCMVQWRGDNTAGTLEERNLLNPANSSSWVQTIRAEDTIRSDRGLCPDLFIPEGSRHKQRINIRESKSLISSSPTPEQLRWSRQFFSFMDISVPLTCPLVYISTTKDSQLGPAIPRFRGDRL